MTPTSCPQCSLANVYPDAQLWICADCGFEWSPETASANEDKDDSGPRIVRDSNGVELKSGDNVVLIKALKLKGSTTLKQCAKASNMNIVDGDHEIECKVDNIGVFLKAEYVKKV